MRRVCLILVCTLLLGACGQKGPLYLPAKPAQNSDQQKEEGK